MDDNALRIIAASSAVRWVHLLSIKVALLGSSRMKNNSFGGTIYRRNLILPLSIPRANDAHRSSTSAGSRHAPDCPTWPNHYDCLVRITQDMVLGCTLR